MTDNSEAVEKLAEIFEVPSVLMAMSNLTSDNKLKAAHAILAAIGADLFTHFPPKPLEWVRDPALDTTEAKTLFGSYLCVRTYADISKLYFTQNEGGRTQLRTSSSGSHESNRAAAETHRNEMLAKEFAK